MNSWNAIFHDRTEAGEILAERLLKYAGRHDVMALALPHGGVPVAAAVARRLRVSLDFLVVRRLGLPGYPNQTMGAIASGGGCVLNERLIEGFGISEPEIDSVAAAEREEIGRMERLYRGDWPDPVLRGRTVILIDDGVATGATMRAAISALRQQQARRVVVAVPTMARPTCREIQRQADELVEVIAPEKFESIGEWYDKFPPVTDDEVQKVLTAADAKLHADGAKTPVSRQERRRRPGRR